MASKMTGIREYRAALRKLPPDLKEEVAAAIRETVDAVHARGKANIAAMVTRRTGVLERNYRKNVSAKALRGRVGYLTEKAQSEAYYARFVHDGTIKMAARPFHGFAVEAEKELDTARMVKARDDALRKATTR